MIVPSRVLDLVRRLGPDALPAYVYDLGALDAHAAAIRAALPRSVEKKHERIRLLRVIFLRRQQPIVELLACRVGECSGLVSVSMVSCGEGIPLQVSVTVSPDSAADGVTVRVGAVFTTKVRTAGVVSSLPAGSCALT